MLSQVAQLSSFFTFPKKEDICSKAKTRILEIFATGKLGDERSKSIWELFEFNTYNHPINYLYFTCVYF